MLFRSYRKPPSSADQAVMTLFKLTPEDYAAESQVDVWPDNWRAVLFFDALGRGNWNMGPNGPTGLRFEAFREARMAMRVTLAEWPELFESVRVMEAAALDEIYKD